MKPLLLLTLLSASAYSQTPTLDKLTTKPKPTPEYQTSKEWFQKEGDSEDSELSMLKNRIDMPTSSAKYKKVPFDELLKLTQQLGGGRAIHRARISPGFTNTKATQSKYRAISSM